MKIQGSHRLPASPTQVWDLLNDPERLAKCLPGCEKLEPVGPDKYRVVVKFAIAAIGGSFAGTVELADKVPPRSLSIRSESKGAPGFVRGQGLIELSPAGGQTELSYRAEAQVGGVIAAVGQRMLEAAARKVIQQFFEAATSQLVQPPRSR